MHMEEKMYDKDVEMQREAHQFQMQMIQTMSSLVNNHSRQPFPPPLATSTQYPRHLTTNAIMMITSLMMMMLHNCE